MRNRSTEGFLLRVITPCSARVREFCIRERLPKVISCSSGSLVAVCPLCFDCDGRLAGAERRVPTMRSGHALTHLRCEGKAGAFLLHLRCGMNDDRLEPRAKPCIAMRMELRPPRPHHRPIHASEARRTSLRARKFRINHTVVKDGPKSHNQRDSVMVTSFHPATALRPVTSRRSCTSGLQIVRRAHEPGYPAPTGSGPFPS